MSEPTRFNINHYVRVRLTPVGWRILVEYEAEINAFLVSIGSEPRYSHHIVEDAEHWSEWQLWELMRVFGGEHMIQSAPVPFETEIELGGFSRKGQTP